MRNKIYFTSDAHLGSRYHEDPRAVERRLCRWLDSIAPTAEAIYFLGDMFDYWFEYKTVVPRGYVRFLGKLGELADQGIALHFFAGNHDVWFADYLTDEIGAIIHHHTEVLDLKGKIFRLSHGDQEYCSLKKSYKFIYHLFRNSLCRKLYAAIHPRWTIGFALRWSLHSRKQGLEKKTIGKIPHAYHNEYFNLEEEHLIQFTKQMIPLMPEIDYYLYGHRHIMVDMALREGRRVMILGDWLQYNSYAVWDGEYLSLEQFEVYD